MLSSECSGMLDTQPTTVYLANPDDPSRNLKFGFWSNTSLHLFPDHCFVGMKFDPTCRQRNLSSTTALVEVGQYTALMKEAVVRARHKSGVLVGHKRSGRFLQGILYVYEYGIIICWFNLILTLLLFCTPLSSRVNNWRRIWARMTPPSKCWRKTSKRQRKTSLKSRKS